MTNTNTSATGGPLISTNVIQLDDIALANILSTLYANLLNIDLKTA